MLGIYYENMQDITTLHILGVDHLDVSIITALYTYISYCAGVLKTITISIGTNQMDVGLNLAILNINDYMHDVVSKWKKVPRYWIFVRGIHRSPR